MEGNIAVSTCGLTKVYGAKTAVDHLDLTMERGELFALLGVNGAGKTTTIRMLTGLAEPTRGTARILGCDIGKEKEKIKRLVGISTQETAVALKLTAEENLRFMARITQSAEMVRGGLSPKEECRQRVDRVIGDLGLEEVRRVRAGKLSGGYKRRLSIAMALIGEPKVLFLDEPTLGLDVLARRELWRVIRKLKENTTIVLTTHYMEEAQALADRIGVMVSGRLLCTGTLAELEAATGKTGLEEVFLSLAEGGEVG